MEPGDELEQGSPIRRTSRNLDEEGADVLPLGDGVLTRNLGLDVVVVVTKVRRLHFTKFCHLVYINFANRRILLDLWVLFIAINIE